MIRVENYEMELKHNGYILIKGKQLTDLNLQFGHVINVRAKQHNLGYLIFVHF
jgi:hypothetical protein